MLLLAVIVEVEVNNLCNGLCVVDRGADCGSVHVHDEVADGMVQGGEALQEGLAWRGCPPVSARTPSERAPKMPWTSCTLDYHDCIKCKERNVDVYQREWALPG